MTTKNKSTLKTTANNFQCANAGCDKITNLSQGDYITSKTSRQEMPVLGCILCTLFIKCTFLQTSKKFIL